MKSSSRAQNSGWSRLFEYFQTGSDRAYTIGVGLRLAGDPTIHMDRCRKIDLAWDFDNPPEWQISIGDERIFQDPAQRAWGKIERLVAGLRDVGVWSFIAIGVGAAALAGALGISQDTTSSAHTAALGSNVSVLHGELMSANTVSFSGVPVSTVPDLIY